VNCVEESEEIKVTMNGNYPWPQLSHITRGPETYNYAIFDSLDQPSGC